jgi:hypothetical protein
MEAGLEIGVRMLGGTQSGVATMAARCPSLIEDSVVLIDRCRLAVLVEIAAGVLAAVFPDIAYGDDPHAGDAKAGLQEYPALLPAAD